MLKKILFLGLAASMLMFSNNLFAEINSIVPLKKPVLSNEEIQKKIIFRFSYITTNVFK